MVVRGPSHTRVSYASRADREYAHTRADVWVQALAAALTAGWGWQQHARERLHSAAQLLPLLFYTGFYLSIGIDIPPRHQSWYVCRQQPGCLPKMLKLMAVLRLHPVSGVQVIRAAIFDLLTSQCDRHAQVWGRV